jgi:dihydrolipoamide dehydrogenase
MAENQPYDVVVIGSGPAGYVAAIRAAQLGLKTAIVEKQFMGGVCLNVGCIPSKALLRNAEIAHILRERSKDFGFSFENLKLDYTVALKRSRQVSDRQVKGLSFLMRKNKIDVLMGTARLIAKDTVQVTDDKGQVQELKTKNVIISTGAHSAVIPGVEVDGKKVLTYTEAILQDTLPKSAVVIGAGAIGVEFTTVWNSYGSKVTLVEMLPRILPLEDPDCSAELTRVYKKRGVDILAGTKVEKIETTESGVKVTVSNEEGQQTIEAEQALLVIGVRPNSKDLGLEELGVAVDKRGFIEIDERMATNVPGIWAIGDVTGKVLLAHVGSAQGVVCAENIAGVETITLDYVMMPGAVYSNPQVAHFGMNEEQAKAAGFDVKVGRFNFLPNGKAQGLGETAGFIKIISDKKYGEILGAHMIGADVSELLPELTLAQRMELTSAEIARNVHTHPTLSEVIMEAAEDVEGHSIHQ